MLSFLPINFRTASKHYRFSVLFIITILFTLLLEYLKIPAALLLAPMLSAIFLSLAAIDLKINSRLFTLAQGIIGCMIGASITPNIIREVLTDWPIFVGGVVSVILAATAIGYYLAKKQILPGTTAIWGAAAGGASAMVIMAEAYGADVRLVAVMQYMRVVLVALTAAALAHFLAPDSIPIAGLAHFLISDTRFPAISGFFPPFSPTDLFLTLVIAFGAAYFARFTLNLAAGGLLLPFMITVILQNSGLFYLVLPPWLLAFFYMIIGWNIGLRFDRAIVKHAMGLLPILLLSTISLMTLCGVFAVILSRVTHVDLLTAYLATSPGGVDSISIIAADSHVNLPFVMAYQSVRFLLVTLTGPLIASATAKYLKRSKI